MDSGWERKRERETKLCSKSKKSNTKSDRKEKEPEKRSERTLLSWQTRNSGNDGKRTRIGKPEPRIFSHILQTRRASIKPSSARAGRRNSSHGLLPRRFTLQKIADFLQIFSAGLLA